MAEGTTVLPPKTALELEDELKRTNAMFGRLLVLVVTRTDLTAAEIGAAIMEPETK